MPVTSDFWETPLGQLPIAWGFNELGDHAFVTKLAGFEYTIHFDYKKSGPIVAIRALNIKRGTLDLSDIHTIPKSTSDQLPRSKLSKGDLVMSYVGTLGRVAVIPADDQFHLAPNVAKISVHESAYVPDFVCHFLNGPQGQKTILEAAASTTQAALSMGNLRRLMIPRLAKPEQRAIATALSDVDALIAGLERLIAKKRDIKQAAMQQLLTGQTRLPGFSGEWEVKRLGHLGAFLKGSGIKRDQAMSGELPCIRYGEIYTVHSDVVRTFHSRISPQVAATATRIQIGDLLFAGSGETKADIGKCVAMVQPIEAYAGGDIVILRLRTGNPEFFGYLLNTPAVVRQKSNRGQGDAVVHISALALSGIEVEVPSVDEQTAIATVLSDIDADLATLEARLTKTRAIKQGMMQELLTGRTRLV